MKSKQINKKGISKTNNLLNLPLLNNKSSNSSYINVWTASPILSLSLLKTSLCNLKKSKLALLSRYRNDLYFTLSPEVFKVGEGNPAFIFENKLREAESNLKRNLQEEVCNDLKKRLEGIKNYNLSYYGVRVKW